MRTRVLILIGLLGAVAITSAQPQRAPATLGDLPNEVRALRAELRQTTRATAQMQLLTVRLQLQEQRLAVLSNQRADAQESDLSAQIAADQNRGPDFNNRLDELERSLK